MSQIIFLAPDKSMLTRARSLLKKDHPDIHIEEGLLSKGVEIATDLLATESEIIITRDGTASAINQDYSARHQGPFIAINCAALPNQILESELFGYVGGAFTGVNPKGKPGLFEVAHEGTIFLDEISEMDYGMQGKLLRVLQEKKSASSRQ